MLIWPACRIVTKFMRVCSFHLFFRVPGSRQPLIPGSAEISVRRLCQDNLLLTTALVAHTADDAPLGGFPKLAKADRKATLEQRGGVTAIARDLATTLTPAMPALLAIHWHKWAGSAGSIDLDFCAEVSSHAELSRHRSIPRCLLAPQGDCARELRLPSNLESLPSIAASMGRLTLFPFASSSHSHALYFEASQRILDHVGSDALRGEDSTAGDEGGGDEVEDGSAGPSAVEPACVAMLKTLTWPESADGSGGSDSASHSLMRFSMPGLAAVHDASALDTGEVAGDSQRHISTSATLAARRGGEQQGRKAASPRTTSGRSSGAWCRGIGCCRTRVWRQPRLCGMIPRCRVTDKLIDARIASSAGPHA